MKKRAISLALAVIMAFGLAVPSFAAGPTFTDVPETYWGYENIEAAAKNGYMNGVGGGLFSPETKVTVAQFLTLLGRLVFPDVKTEGSDWYGPYVAKTQETGMLNGSQVDVNNVTAEITRYDMAVILRAAAKKLGVAEKTAQQSQVTDYLDIPTRYAEAVLAVYGMGLIKGDEKNNFNGANTMKRAEVATVIMRLSKAIPGGNTNPGNTTTEPTKSDYEKQTTEEYLESNQDNLVTYTVNGYFQKTDHDIGRPAYDKHFYDFPDMPYKVYYTKDGGKTSVLVAEGITGNKQAGENPPHGEGTGEIKVEVQLPEDAFVKDWNQQGIYFSAETEVDGQKLVTSDLRTDGRAYVTVKNPNVYLSVELTPPTGEKAKFTIKGAITYGLGGVSRVGEGFTVQLHLKDGRVLAETTTEADGRYTLDCEVDAIDNGFDVNIEQYYVTASGILNGVPMKSKETRLNGELALYSLDFIGGNPYSSRSVSWYVDVFSVE